MAIKKPQTSEGTSELLEYVDRQFERFRVEFQELLEERLFDIKTELLQKIEMTRQELLKIGTTDFNKLNERIDITQDMIQRRHPE